MYYRIFDTQTGCYMATGHNATSKEQVKTGVWDYFLPDREEIFLTDDINKISLQILLDVGEFILEDSKTKFEEFEF